MSKIICDICGTVYPENATMCPICGCPKTSDAEAVIPVQDAAEAGTVRTAQKVKGGRFSNKNVKKRNQSARSDVPSRPNVKKEKEPREEKSNRGLIIAVLVLLAAVILLGTYIGLRFFAGAGDRGGRASAATGTSETQTTTTAPRENGVACTDLNIAGIDLEKGVQLQGEGRTWRMAVTAFPENTTEEITYASSDESVVTVSVNGSRVDLISVAPGTATVTVSCGSVSKKFKVECKVDETTAATEESTEPSETTEETEPEGFKLNRSDITFKAEGETFTFNPGRGISPVQCTWTTADETIATVDNGKVIAVAPGVTEITAEYNGVKSSCIVRCSWEEETGSTDETDSTESTGETESTETTENDGETWEISHSDVTIRVGDDFVLRLRSSDGETVDVSWNTHSWLNGGNVSVSGNTITGVTAGECTVSCIYDGVEYKCVVHIR